MQLNRKLPKFRGPRLQTGPREIELRPPDFTRRRSRATRMPKEDFVFYLKSPPRKGDLGGANTVRQHPQSKKEDESPLFYFVGATGFEPVTPTLSR